MTPGRRSWFNNPVFLLGLAAALIAFVVQSGEVGSADTMHRLQSTHSFWTSQPPVFPSEYPEFGVHGRNGSLQSWYGIGQSLLVGHGAAYLHARRAVARRIWRARMVVKGFSQA